MIDELTIYYVFSTIAQTLAAVFAIVAAFATVRLADLARRLEDGLGSLGHHTDNPTFYSDLADGNYESPLSDLLGRDISWDTESLLLEVCKRKVVERQAIISGLRRSLLVATVVIALSIATLPFAKLLASVPFLATSVLTGGVAVAIAGLAMAADLVRVASSGALQRKKKSRKSPSRGAGIKTS